MLAAAIGNSGCKSGPNVVAVMTSRAYLQELLARMRMPKTDRAFPETLAEWKYIDGDGDFWGMRHFNWNQPQLDPAKEVKAKLVYLSDDTDKIDQIERNGFPPGTEVGSTAALHIAYRNLSPEVIESSYDLSRSRPLSWFFFVFMAQLGYAVYV